MPATVEDISNQYEDLQVKIGGGGYVKGQSFADDGTHMIYSDTGLSCYVRDPNDPARRSFENLFHKSKLVNPGDADHDVWSGGGWGASLCAIDSKIGYFGQYDSLWKTTDRGLTIERLTAFTPSDGMGNYHDGPKFTEHVIACDPNNGDVAYAGTVTTAAGKGRVRFSSDGGNSFSEVDTSFVPVPTWKPWSVCHIAFDRSSGTISVGGQTRTARVVIHSQGNGFSESIDGGQTFMAIGGPTLCKCMEFAADGTLYANHNTQSTLVGSAFHGVWRYDGETWTDISPGGVIQALSLACDPNDSGRVVILQENALVTQTLDRGATWSPQTHNMTINIGTDGAAWLTGVHPSISVGSGKFDPSVPDRFTITTGLTVYATTLATSYPSGVVDWTQEYNGELENLVTMNVAHYAEGHPVIFAVMDKDIFAKFPQEMHEYPTGTVLGEFHGEPDPFGTRIGSINHGTNMGGTSREVYAVIGGNNTFDRVSRDGGRSWEWLTTRPFFDVGGTGAAFGQVAVNHYDPMNIVRTPTAAHQALPRYTVNGGASWATSAFSPMPVPGGGFHQAYYCGKQATVADPNNAGHFYIAYAGQTDPNENPGLYESTDGGATFARVLAGYITGGSGDFWHLRLRLVPGHPGHMWAAGPGSNSGLRRSVDYGRTWTDVPSTSYIGEVCLGKPAPGAAYPAIYTLGQLADEQGIYRSIDEGETWQRMATGNSPDLMTYAWAMDADKGIFGRLYYAVGGAGGFRYMKLKDEPAQPTRVRLS